MGKTPCETLQDLYEIPIERFVLPRKTIRFLKWEGITNVGACIRFYIRDAYRREELSRRLSLVMYGEVKPEMEEHGHWTYVLDSALWDISLWRNHARPHEMIVFWQGREQDLYQVPLERLGLSDDAREGLEIFKLETIGQWIQEYDYFYDSSHIYGDNTFVQDDLYNIMLWEIMLRMKEQDCWPFIADSLCPE